MKSRWNSLLLGLSKWVQQGHMAFKWQQMIIFLCEKSSKSGSSKMRVGEDSNNQLGWKLRNSIAVEKVEETKRKMMNSGFLMQTEFWVSSRLFITALLLLCCCCLSWLIVLFVSVYVHWYTFQQNRNQYYLWKPLAPWSVVCSCF